MKILPFLSILAAGILLFSSCSKKVVPEQEKQSGAGLALDAWGLARSYPDGRIYTSKITAAFEARQGQGSTRGEGNEAHWRALGPKNIGGRTLCLAFHPTNPDIIFAGSASGGLWKTTTAGVGYTAWEYIPTGFPVLGVGAIAIDPVDPDVMYIGTGEVYNYQGVGTGFTVRTNRGTYGIGILKTTDGGDTWTKSLDWSYSDLRGVQRLLLNPLNHNTIFAATTEGLYRSHDAGNSWSVVSDIPMAVDIEINPNDTNIVYVTHGSLSNPVNGIYRSVNGGNSFVELTDGLPASYKGKTLLGMSASDPDIIYASVGDSATQVGLYKTTNGGNNWSLVNSTDVAKYQGWYSHDVAVKPDDPNTFLFGGIDVFKSTDSGVNLTQKSYWNAWTFGQTPVGGPEGPPDYVHADIHALYFHPAVSNAAYAVTDGGIFYSGDNGETWEGRNGSYQTQQFYANFSNSQQDSVFAIGGMQDNATAIYTGGDSWFRIIGGDGMSTAIDPENDNVVYGTTQYLGLRRSDDHAQSFHSIKPPDADGEILNFNGPFELTPSLSGGIYAGGQRLHFSADYGQSWNVTNNNFVDNGNPVLTIAVAPDNADVLFISTAPSVSPPAHVLKSTDGGDSWTVINGLPDRICMDIAFHPYDAQTVYAVFSGFNTHHVYKTNDGGDTWQIKDAGLPDVPHNSLLIDPLFQDELYVGTDIGVYFSPDGGDTWAPYSDGLPEAALAMHLSISWANRKLRVATHGNGVYEGDFVAGTYVGTSEIGQETQVRVFPNPVMDKLNIEIMAASPATVEVRLFDIHGRTVIALPAKAVAAGQAILSVDMSALPAGTYFYSLTIGGKHLAGKVSKA